MKKITIHTDMIQLDQLLKWADVISSGGQVRILIDERRVYVNGELCQVKRKQLHPGDIVEVRGIDTLQIVGE